MHQVSPLTKNHLSKYGHNFLAKMVALYKWGMLYYRNIYLHCNVQASNFLQEYKYIAYYSENITAMF